MDDDLDDDWHTKDDPFASRDNGGFFNPAHDEDKLAEDGDPPTAPADDIKAGSPIDDPLTDDELDSDELYQEGISGATNSDDEEIEPNEEPEPLESYDDS